MNDSRKTAGGRATEAGMGFQAAVATWFAAQLLSDMPIGTLFGLPRDLKVASFQCETGDALDDVVVHLEGGGAIYTQCKTRPSLDKSVDSPLAKTLNQLVDLYFQHGQVDLTSTPNVALLAVATDASQSLDILEAACRMFDYGGSWDSIFTQVPNDKRSALALFKSHVLAAAATSPGRLLSDEDLVALARLFHVRRFSEDATGSEWRVASHQLGRCLFGSDEAGEAPLTALLGLSRKFILTGAPVDRGGLLRALRGEGHIDVSAPGFDKDVAAVLAYSEYERNRLRKHTCLPLGDGIPILRECLDPLFVAVQGGSLLVTGEPGAGKTGVLLALADRLARGPGLVLFLSVERFSGFNKQSDFRSELKLDHDLLEVLVAWPGIGPGVLIVDALDASRGGTSEPVIAAFIADAVKKIGARWSIVASIRSFDLRNGRHFREMMRGEPPNINFTEGGMANVRHFHVPRLSQGELGEVSTAAPKLHELTSVAPQPLQDLLCNIFNLSLAAEMLDSGVEAQSIQSVATQSELIQRYEDIRLPTQALKRAVNAAVSLMVHRGQLTIRTVDIQNDLVEEVRKAGVLVSAGDRVAFAHHVLFDHIASRFYLRWDDSNALLEQLSGDSSSGLLLGPALRFALERVWREDSVGRATTWRFLAQLSAMPKPDPVVVSISMRTAAERVEVPDDVRGVCAMITAATDVRSISRLLSQLARFVGLVAKERGGLPPPAVQAWAMVACEAAKGEDHYLADATRILLMTLSEKSDFSDANFLVAFGEAARGLLRHAWALNPENPILSTAGIRFVSKSFGSDPAASRALLERILEDRFDQYASQEAPCLAEGIPTIIPYDSKFVARIYETLFTRNVTDERKTWIGGSPSRILPLTSTHQQDYQHARWQLNNALKAFLDSDPMGGTVAVIGAVRGLDKGKHRISSAIQEPTVIDVRGRSIQVIDDLLSIEDWRKGDSREEEPLTVFQEFLRSCQPEAFRGAVEMALELPTNAAVWTRILGIAADRPGVADDLLWPLVCNPRFLALQGLAHDAIIFLVAIYGLQPPETRGAFEETVLAEGLFPDDRESRWWRSILARFLSSVPQDLLVTQGTRALKAEMEAAGELIGNNPLVNMTVGWHSEDNIVDRMLRNSGVDLERSPDREIRAASRKVQDDLSQGSGKDNVAGLVGLWRDIIALIDAIDAGDAAKPHPHLLHSSWGAVSNGVERLATNPNYNPDISGLPDIVALLKLIDRLSDSPFPEASNNLSDQMAWGNLDVRVYAASSIVALAPRFGTDRPDLVDRMEAFLDDPVPTVRLQVAQALNLLWNVARDRMWSMVSEVVAQETHGGVLSFFLAGPMGRLSRQAPERCAHLLSQLLERKWAEPFGEEQSGRERDLQSYSNLTAYLFVAREQPEAWTWIEQWTADLRRGEAYLSPMFFGLREVFFFPFREAPKANELEMAHRAKRLLDFVVDAAIVVATEARTHLHRDADDSAVNTWQPSFVAADRVIHQVCNQLYFGSGAFQRQGDTKSMPGLQSVFAKQKFLIDYANVLDAIATHAQVRTVHNFLELLDYLVEGNPTEVFDRVTKSLLGPAAEDGYQFESLGLDFLVKLVRRYLADHRDIFEDNIRRQKLIEVLELFSSSGWPEPMKLLFELPDLLR